MRLLRPNPAAAESSESAARIARKCGCIAWPATRLADRRRAAEIHRAASESGGRRSVPVRFCDTKNLKKQQEQTTKATTRERFACLVLIVPPKNSTRTTSSSTILFRARRNLHCALKNRRQFFLWAEGDRQNVQIARVSGP